MATDTVTYALHLLQFEVVTIFPSGYQKEKYLNLLGLGSSKVQVIVIIQWEIF